MNVTTGQKLIPTICLVFLISSSAVAGVDFGSAEKLLGETVYREHDKIGQIERVLINRKNRQVSSVVVAEPIGLMGLDHRYYIIPFKKISRVNGDLMLNLTLSDFKQAPYLPVQKYDKGDLLEDHWIKESYEYYDETNYQLNLYDEIGYEDDNAECDDEDECQTLDKMDDGIMKN